MPSNSVSATNTLNNPTNSLTEYKEKYTWPKQEKRQAPPQNCDDTVNQPHIAIDPNMYKTTNHDDYKPYAPDAYRAPEPESDDAAPERAPVDPNMYKTTNHDDYKPYAPDAYRAPEPESDDAAPERAPVDPNMYRTTHRDDYKPYARDAYIPSRKESMQPDEVQTPVSEYAGAAPTRADAVAPVEVPHLDLASRIPSSSKPPSVASARSSVAPTPRSRKSSARYNPYVTTKQTDFAPPPPSAYAGVYGPLSSRRSSVASAAATPRVRHVDPDHFTTTKQHDFAPVAPAASKDSRAPDASKPSCVPSLSRPQSQRRSAADTRDFATEYKQKYVKPAKAPSTTPAVSARPAAACVHHVDPSFYTTTNRAAFMPHSVVPVRPSYTQPTPSVRHVDPSMYITSSQAAYKR